MTWPPQPRGISDRSLAPAALRPPDRPPRYLLLRDGSRHRRHPHPPHRGSPVHRQADRVAPDLRRPGGHRDRERPPVHRAAGAQPGADRSARAADGHQRDPEGHLELADRHRSRSSTPSSATQCGCAARSDGAVWRYEATRGYCRPPQHLAGRAGKLPAHSSRPIGDDPAHEAAHSGRYAGRFRMSSTDASPGTRASDGGRGACSALSLWCRCDAMRQIIGSIGVSRIARSTPSHRPRSSCSRTFADQAVIAIENARLFSELQQRTGELSRSVERAPGARRGWPGGQLDARPRRGAAGHRRRGGPTGHLAGCLDLGVRRADRGLPSPGDQRSRPEIAEILRALGDPPR